MPRSNWKKNLDKPTEGVEVSQSGQEKFEDLVKSTVLAYVNKGSRLDPLVVKDLYNSAEEIAFLLGWKARPKAKVEPKAEEVEAE